MPLENKIQPKEMSASAGSVIGTIIGVALGSLAWYWWQVRQITRDSKVVDTGQKTADGKSIVEVTGVGGEDDGVKISGYILPDNIDEVQLPLTVIVRPNKNLFLGFKVGQKVTFPKKMSDELVWPFEKMGGVGEYREWYPELIKKVVGVI